MSPEAWAVFALFWVVFVTAPGPNAVNCIDAGLTHGFARGLWGVAGILTQAALFLGLSGAGAAALLAAAPDGFFLAGLLGAAVLIWLGLRGWIAAARPVTARPVAARSIYLRAFLIATLNAKSVAGYLAAFTQFVEPGVPVREQMSVIVPTALAITALSYTGYTAIGAGLGRAALSVVPTRRVRRAMAACFVAYGLALGAAALAGS